MLFLCDCPHLQASWSHVPGYPLCRLCFYNHRPRNYRKPYRPPGSMRVQLGILFYGVSTSPLILWFCVATSVHPPLWHTLTQWHSLILDGRGFWVRQTRNCRHVSVGWVWGDDKGRPGGKDKKKAKIEHLNDDLKANIVKFIYLRGEYTSVFSFLFLNLNIRISTFLLGETNCCYVSMFDLIVVEMIRTRRPGLYL